MNYNIFTLNLGWQPKTNMSIYVKLAQKFEGCVLKDTVKVIPKNPVCIVIDDRFDLITKLVTTACLKRLN